MDNILAQLAVVAVLVQRIIDFLKTVTGYEDYLDDTNEKRVTIGLSIVASGALCVAWQVDVFAAAGFEFAVAWVGAALTGIFAGLGSNVINDLIKILDALKKQARARATLLEQNVVATNPHKVKALPKG